MKTIMEKYREIAKETKKLNDMINEAWVESCEICGRPAIGRRKLTDSPDDEIGYEAKVCLEHIREEEK